MWYYILTDRGTVITRSTVAKLEEPDLIATRQEIERFDQTVCAILQPTEFADFVDPDARAMRQQEALKVARRERTGDRDDEDIWNRHTLYEINEGICTDSSHPVSMSTLSSTMRKREPKERSNPTLWARKYSSLR